MMLLVLMTVALGQCNGSSCSRPAAVAAPAAYSGQPFTIAQEPRQAIYAPGACSGQPAFAGRKKGGFRPFGGLFGGRRGSCN